MSYKQESLQILKTSETTGDEFSIFGSAIVSLEPVTTELADGAGLDAVIALAAFVGAGALTFTISGADAGGGNIVIAGQDANGNAQTQTLAFTGADGTMMTTDAYTATSLTVTPNTFTQGTVEVSVLVPISGSWVVQSSRRNADPRRWSNEFEVGDALTAAIPLAELQGSPNRVYRVTGGAIGVEGWVDEVFDRIWE